MRFAVIDLGTNTFHLLIAEVKNQDFSILYKTNAPVKLGEGRLNDNVIIEAAFNRGVDQLVRYAEKIHEFQVDHCRATGTSAIRSATNGQEFIQAVQERTGITIEAISGDEEANLIYEGVKLSGAINGMSLIMDIGGGSTEFIICNTEELIWKKSYPVGAARLMQRFFKSDPLNESDAQAITEHLSDTLTDLKQVCTLHQPLTLIGSAGAFETFTCMINPGLNLKEITHAKIDFEAYKTLSSIFLKSSHQERQHMEGLIPLRVDMIVMAALITNYVLEFSSIQKITLSTYDLKMGVLANLMAQSNLR